MQAPSRPSRPPGHSRPGRPPPQKGLCACSTADPGPRLRAITAAGSRGCCPDGPVSSQQFLPPGNQHVTD